ncbi:hypothetical protein, partial [Pseudomonas syringae]|uniref:hypothetical protein n=2 Tax=Pseudomonas TaxID=286 RepID=UPI001F1792F0
LCRVRTFVDDASTVVLLTDLDAKNDGQSVTNAGERIIKSLQDLGIVVGSATYVEHYERNEPESEEFNHKINQANGQLRSRMGHIYPDVGPFRGHAYSLRI